MVEDFKRVSTHELKRRHAALWATVEAAYDGETWTVYGILARDELIQIEAELRRRRWWHRAWEKLFGARGA